MEDRIIEVSATQVYGDAAFRGGVGRSGVVANAGVRSAGGIFWRLRPGGAIVGAAVAHGRFLYVATSENRLYGLEVDRGRTNLVIQTNTPLTGTPAIGKSSVADTDPLLVFTTTDGVVHAYNALRSGPTIWEFATDSVVRAAPLVVDESVYVATESGSVVALDLSSGRELWRYSTTESSSSFQSAPAYHDGIVYVTSREGSLHPIDASTGVAVCSAPVALTGEAATSPIISAAGVVFAGIEQGGIHAFAAGQCGVPANGYAMFYPSSRSAREGLVATDETLYLVEDRLVLSMRLEAEEWADAASSGVPSPWSTPFAADDLVSSPPVLGAETLYVGTQDGKVNAIDAPSGTPLWQFDAGSPLRGETVVLEGAVIVTTADGEIIAIAPK
jgi:outer membrane protein assembly factor BamB